MLLLGKWFHYRRPTQMSMFEEPAADPLPLPQDAQARGKPRGNMVNKHCASNLRPGKEKLLLMN